MTVPSDAELRQDLEVGLEGRYRIEERIGRGGMGSVFLAQDIAMNRPVAIKVVHGLEADQLRLERFRREGEITASLNHEGIVKVFTSGVVGGRPYLVYEFVEGATLDERMRELAARQRVELVRDAARALGFAHERGVVHRDVKPENLLLDREGTVRVADFGLANAQGLERITSTGAVLGTPRYMAPEQAVGRPAEQGPPTDVFSLGVVLYESLTGRAPFDGSTFVELLAQICKAEPERPRRIDPRIDGDLEAICLKALSRAPADRYPTAGALADDLDAYLAGGPVVAPRLPAVAARVAGVALGLVLVLVVGAAALIAGVPRDRPSPPVVTPKTSSPTKTHEPARPAPTKSPAGLAFDTPLVRIDVSDRRYPPGVRGVDVHARFVAPDRVVTLGHQKRGHDSAALWDLAGERPRAVRRWPSLGRTLPTSLHVLPEGFLVLIGDSPKVLWCPWKGKQRLFRLVVPGKQYDVRIASARVEGELLLAVTRGKGPVLARLDPERGVRVIRLLEWDGISSSTLAFFAGGTRVAVGGSSPGDLGMLRVYEARTGKLQMSTSDGIFRRVRCLAVRPDGAAIAVGTMSGRALTYHPDRSTPQLELVGPPRTALARVPVAHERVVIEVAYSPHSELLYTLSNGEPKLRENVLRVWNARSGKRMRDQILPNRAHSLVLSPDGQRLLIGFSRGVALIFRAR